MSKREKPDEWMPLYVGDYLRDTMHLTAEQHGAYLLLLMHYWVRRGPLPDDDGQLSAIAKTELKIWRKSVRKVVSNFFEISDGKWTQKRMQSEIARAVGISESRSLAGKEGGARSAAARFAREKEQANEEANWQAKQQATAQANGQQTAKQNATPLPKRQDSSAVSSSLRSARESTRDQLLALCEVLKVSPATNAAIIPRWTDELQKLVAEGFDFEKHILPSAQAAVAKGAKPQSLNYLRGKAGELRAAEEMQDAQRRVLPQSAKDEDWRVRMRIHSGLVNGADKGSWSDKWGPKPGEADCLVPGNIVEEFRMKETA